jgi:4-amino-4-deoxy-L-arabinose transferase-like glycosyltransferase
MSVARHEIGRLALVLVLAFVARCAFVTWWHTTHDPHQFEFPDSASYWDLGRDLTTGSPYAFGEPERRIIRAPGYPLLLAPLFRAIGPDVSPAAARWLGVVVGTLTVGAVYWLARTMFDGRVALIAALVVAVYPETIATSVLPLSDGPFCLWMVLQLAVWRMAVDATTDSTSQIAGLGVSAGILGGIATLTRPSWLLFSPLFALAAAIVTRLDRRQLIVSCCVLAGIAAAMLPWWMRSYHITGRFVPTVLWVGPSLYDGWNPQADGSSNMDFVPRFEAQLLVADAANPPAASDPPFEYRFDRLLRDEAIAWAKANPSRVLVLAAIKLQRMWNIWPNEPAFRSVWVRAGIAATYVPLMFAAICGAWQLRRRRFDLLLLLAPAVYFSLIHAVFIGSLRYRQPAIMTLAILAAVAIDALLRRRATATTSAQSIS